MGKLKVTYAVLVIWIYIESTWKRITYQFFALTTGLFGILYFSDYTLETLKTPRERVKTPGTFLLDFDSV